MRLSTKGSVQTDFKEQLLLLMDKKNHWAWKHFTGPSTTLAQLKVHYLQEYAVYIRDFPIFLGRLHQGTPSASVRRDLVTNLYEEETGGLSLGKPHPELFLKMMKGLGFRPADFRQVTLLPKSRRYRGWLDQGAHHRVEQGHRIAAWRMVLGHARSSASQQRIVDALRRSLELWLAYRDGVAEAAGV